MDSQPPVRVMIVDDHDAVRYSLRLFLSLAGHFEVAGEAENGQEALNLLGQIQPHVVLMDLVMPVMDGVTATRIIHQQYPQIKIIVLTSAVDLQLIQNAIQAGAHSYILKGTPIDALAISIRAAVQ